jgi:uncharacterized protein YdhG (YjbR/CyaY superfamily)
MEKKQNVYDNIDEYIGNFPKEVQEKLSQLRKTIHAAAPDAEERISYQMPTFWLRGNLVYFAAFKNHLGFFPTGSGIAAFQKESAGYTTGKGTLQFPLDRPLPLDLITKIVKFRVSENLRKYRETTEKRRVSRSVKPDER